MLLSLSVAVTIRSGDPETSPLVSKVLVGAASTLTLGTLVLAMLTVLHVPGRQGVWGLRMRCWQVCMGSWFLDLGLPATVSSI